MKGLVVQSWVLESEGPGFELKACPSWLKGLGQVTYLLCLHFPLCKLGIIKIIPMFHRVVMRMK